MSITTSLSPNVQRDDLVITAKTLFSFWLWRDEKILRKIEARLFKRYPKHEVALLSSGRSATYYALQALEIGPGDEVIIQAFTCLAVPSPIKWVGAKPIYADIKHDTYNVDTDEVRKKITPRTKAIIVQHTFGIPAPVRELKDVAKQHSLYLIEDLAHSFGATVNGQAVGTFGDVAILSFGRDKTISCVFGGAVISSNADLIAKIKDKQKTLPFPSFWWTKQQLLHPLLMAVIKPLYFRFGLGKILLVAGQKLKLLSLAVTKAEKTGAKPPYLKWRFSPALGFLLNNQLNKIDQYTKHRRNIAGYYISKIHSNKSYGSLQKNAGWLRFPLVVKNPGRLMKVAQKNKILLGDWYNSPVTPTLPNHSEASEYKQGSCPEAEHIAKHVINLPTHQAISRNQADEIVTFLSEYLKND